MKNINMKLRVILLGTLFLFGLPISGIAQQTDSQDRGYLQAPQPENTKRYCLTLELNDDPDLIAEYEKMHQPQNIWKEVVDGIKKVGVIDSEIYRSGTLLVMILTTPADFDFDQQMGKLADLPRQSEWEAFMSKYQASDPNASSGEKWLKMKRIFKLSPIEDQ
ncbi:L-rhamnose mutarotase [Pareuzebyella sediminis]|nr:L-rhamnose mutarotase [Pareuzebyella sediminis]